MTQVDERPRYTIRKIKNIGIDNKIDGKILKEDYILKGKKVKEEYTDEDGKLITTERYEHVYPSPGKEVLVGKMKYKIHSIDIPKDEAQNKIINVL